jgi:multidrug transporter EmrE-like cation transporter
VQGLKIVGLVLLIAGILGAAYGGFSYTKETHDAKIGPVKIELKEKEHVNVPVWAGIAVAVVGAVLLFQAPART